MNFTLNQLRIFLKVAEKESITKAAEELHLTQPAVSIQLKNFQQQFEVPLTEVVHRKLWLTDFGREVARSAEAILNEAYAINYKAAIHQGKLTGRLKISSVSTGKYVIPYFLSGFKKKHPDVEIILDVTNKSGVLSHIRNNEVDFALVSILPDEFEVNRVELMPNELYLVGPASVHRSEVSVSTLGHADEFPLIFREPGSGTRLIMEKFLSENQLHPLKAMQLTSNEAVKQAVMAGLGYSIMPLIGITNELRHGILSVISCPGLPIRTTWQLISVPHKRFTPAAAAFLEHVGSEKANIISERFSAGLEL